MPNLNQTEIKNGDYTYTYYNPANKQYVVSVGMSRSSVISTVRTGTVTPSYTRKAETGKLPVNTFTYRRMRKYGAYGSCTFINDSTRVEQSYSGFIENTVFQSMSEGKRTLSSADIAAYNASASNSLLLKIKDQKVNLAQVFAERKMTIDLLASTATKLVSVIANLRRGDFRAAASDLGIKISRRSLARLNRGFGKNQSKAIANGWLELQYGWKPLLQDVYGSAEAVANAIADTGPPVVRVSGRRRVDRGFNETIKIPQEIDCYLETEIDYTAKYVVYFRLGNEVLKVGTALGLTNPALIAWELLPYSFVIDWFVPIGNWLSSLDATNGCVFEKGSFTTFVRTRQSYLWAGSVQRTSDKKIGKARAYHEWVDVDRIPLSGFPSARFPSFKNPLSLDHALNAMALLTQSFKK